MRRRWRQRVHSFVEATLTTPCLRVEMWRLRDGGGACKPAPLRRSVTLLQPFRRTRHSAAHGPAAAVLSRGRPRLTQAPTQQCASREAEAIAQLAESPTWPP